MNDDGDRELDAWVAQNVMGLVRVTRFGMDWWVPAEEIEVPLPSDGIRVENYKPTVSYDQAFMALEKAVERRYVRLEWWGDEYWQCRIYPPNPLCFSIQGEASTAPLAICRGVKAYREAQQ